MAQRGQTVQTNLINWTKTLNQNYSLHQALINLARIVTLYKSWEQFSLCLLCCMIDAVFREPTSVSLTGICNAFTKNKNPFCATLLQTDLIYNRFIRAFYSRCSKHSGRSPQHRKWCVSSSQFVCPILSLVRTLTATERRASLPSWRNLNREKKNPRNTVWRTSDVWSLKYCSEDEETKTRWSHRFLR